MARLPGRYADKPGSHASRAGRPDTQAKQAGKQADKSDGQASQAGVQAGRHAGRQENSGLAAGKQAKLRANKVRQARGPKEAQGVTREGGRAGA